VLFIESSHVAILLLAYIGIDLVYGGAVSFRILNSSAIMHGPCPVLGDTIQGRLEFLELIKSGTATLIKLKYTCYNRGGVFLTQELLGGFFTEEDLRDNKGILATKQKQPHLLPSPLYRLQPRREPVTDMDGFFAGLYGPMLTPTHRLDLREPYYVCPEARMLDRILSMEFQGGHYGLGYVVAEKEIDQSHWAFSAHFKNDPVFPGSLLAEAANQINLLFALNAGYLSQGSYTLGSKKGLPIISIFRGQVRPVASVIRFEVQIKEIIESDRQVVIVSDCDVYWQSSHVMRTENASLIIEEILF
jgi:3-hydroxymyristoyl/3-hydroxydecanoyl-(acyl carrier protein) dehydratase